jgi:nitrate reductase gamma subunit
MAELSTNQLVKIILGVLVFVAVVLGIYLFFKNKIIDFFNNLVTTNSDKLFFSLLK